MHEHSKAALARDSKTWNCTYTEDEIDRVESIYVLRLPLYRQRETKRAKKLALSCARA